MFIYDSHLKQKVKFEPITPNEARIYVCGPTIYDDAHLGHARSSIAFDLLRRTLKESGYKVTFAKNFTDIDDKIINKAKQNNTDIKTLTKIYEKSYIDSMQALNVLEPDLAPKATENINEIIAFTQKLLDSGFAYRIENHGVYLSVKKDEKYGSISMRGLESDENLARVENDELKHDLRDFALWKQEGESEFGYDSPFGKGRPGWHIECSAMIESSLAYKDSEFGIDIHCGGADLLFPHHENEACQTRCFSGRELAKYWVHNGFVTINGEKMSKSLGNSFFINDALKIYSGEMLRNYLMSMHYRAPLHFNEEDLLSHKKRLDKIYRLKKRVNLQEFSQNDLDSSFKKALLESMQDDLNISKAFMVLEENIAHLNAKLDSAPKDKGVKKQILANLDFVEKLLGIGGGDCIAYFQFGVSDELKQQINNLINERNEAKKNKDYAKADSLREQLTNMGIHINDTALGTIWEKV